MRVSLVVVCLIAAVAAAYAGEPTERRLPAPKRAAWEWSLEERLAARLDPASIKERAEAARRESTPVPAGIPQVHATGVGPIQFIIDGKRNPELLMKFELFRSLLAGLRAEFKEEVREQYREAIAASGWTEDEFWTVLESAASDLMQAQAESLLLQGRMRASSPPERRELEAKVEELGLKQCRLRARALDTVRARLGRDRFERFLYTAVASEISILSSEPAGDEAARLRLIEGGCR